MSLGDSTEMGSTAVQHLRRFNFNRFNLQQWLPKRLYCYGQVVLPPAIVWATVLAMLLTWVVVIHRYAADWPFWDELSYLPYAVGAQPLSWAFFWADHNGHR